MVYLESTVISYMIPEEIMFLLFYVRDDAEIHVHITEADWTIEIWTYFKLDSKS